jgi:hypothetical protein
MVTFRFLSGSTVLLGIAVLYDGQCYERAFLIQMVIAGVFVQPVSMQSLMRTPSQSGGNNDHRSIRVQLTCSEAPRPKEKQQ